MSRKRSEGFTTAFRAVGETDVLANSLSLEVTPQTNKRIVGTNIITARVLSPGFNQFRFQLDSNYTITSLKLDGRTITFTREDSRNVVANFDVAYGVNTVFSLQIGYDGLATAVGLGSIEFGTHSGAPYVFSLSEPYYASTWWPTKDDNTDKFLADVAITCPNTLKGVSNGILQGVDVVDTTRSRYRWKSNYPISPYLVFIAVTNFNNFTDTYTHSTGSMPLDYWIWPEYDLTANRNAWKTAKTILGTLSSKYGPYPFLNEKYGIYQFTFSGGMEHQTSTGMGGFWESVNAHELGHQWWGDLVTCATWSDIWLNEGFATYSEALWSEFKPGSTGLAALKSTMSSLRPSSVNGSVYCYVTTDVNRIFSTSFSYRKPGWVLHMLRSILGDTAFFGTLADYRAAYGYSTADTEDFIAVAEARYGGSLRWFFDPWIYDIGAPSYTYGTSATTAGGQTYLLLQVSQKQSASYPKFRMPIDLQTTIGGVTTRRKIWNNAVGDQWYVIPVSATPSAVSLDPDTWVLATGLTTAAYVAGPPVLVASTPAPGGNLANRSRTITLQFQSAVNATSAAFTVRNKLTSEVLPKAYAYDATNKRVTLTLPSKMAEGEYEVVIADTVTSTAGVALDGELSAFAATLPSGNGTPGGATVLPFRYVPTKGS